MSELGECALDPVERPDWDEAAGRQMGDDR